MRKVFFILFLVLVSLCQAQPIKSSGLNCYLSTKNNTKGLNSSFSDRFCLYDINGQKYISLIIKVKDPNNTKFLNKYDHFLGSQVGKIITIRLNVNQLDSFCKDKNILVIEASEKINGPLLKEAKHDLLADSVNMGVNLRQAYNGEDVLIGIADWGMDLTHPTFYDTTYNTYRIKAMWDQCRNAGPAPEGFNYGTVFSTQEDLLAAGCDTTNIYDTGSHATHVGGICAGSGAGTPYIGIAPSANILFCSWKVDIASYMDGCSWMRNVAKQEGKRLVINNSWGVYLFGRMDGGSLLDEFINTMSEQDSVVFATSAGNDGECKFHLLADFDSIGHSDTIRSEVGFNFPVPSSKHYWGETITLQSENNTDFATKIELYDYAGQLIGQTPLVSTQNPTVNQDFIITELGDSMIYRASARDNTGDCQMIDWEVRQSKYVSNNYHVVLCIVANTGKVHAWNVACLTTGVGNWGLDFTNLFDSTYIEGDDHYGLGEPALAEKAITVAAHKYRMRSSYQNTIASFSSRGPNLTTYLKPEISAPGFQIISAYSSFASEKMEDKITVDYNGKTYQFQPMSGTSMSCPMVSGAIALILQANNKLSVDEIRDIIFQTAKTDQYTGQCPNYTWGYGKLNAYSAVAMAENMVSIDDIKMPQLILYPNPAKDYLTIEGIGPKSQIYIVDMVGRKVETKLLSQNQIDISSLTKGVYILNIKSKADTYKIKFVKQ